MARFTGLRALAASLVSSRVRIVFALLLVTSLAGAWGGFHPSDAEATVRVRIDWDNWQAPGTGNTGNVTAGVIERFKRIYTQFMPPNSTLLVLITSNNNLSIDVTIYVTSLLSPRLFGNAIAFGNSSCFVFGGTVNSAASTLNITNDSALVNALGHTVAHEFGHTQGLMHNNNTSNLMVAGPRINTASRFLTNLPDRLTATDQNILLTTMRTPGSAHPRGGTRDGVRTIRGVGELEEDDHDDDGGCSFHAQLNAPPGYTLGWVNIIGEFIPTTITGSNPIGDLFFPSGQVFTPALRQDLSGNVIESGLPGEIMGLNPIPSSAALDPIPSGPSYYQAARAMFSGGFMLVLDATFDSTGPQPFGNGFEIIPATASSVGPRGDAVPGRMKLHQNVPNPFSPSTRVSFDLPVSSKVTLTIFDSQGRKVRTLADGVLDAGAHDVTWDGSDDRGGRAAAGVYFYRLQAGGEMLSGRMVLQK